LRAEAESSFASSTPANFTEKYSERDLGCLEAGVLMELEGMGLVHYLEVETEQDLELMVRGGADA
jgi:hypothetical protein